MIIAALYIVGPAKRATREREPAVLGEAVEEGRRP